MGEINHRAKSLDALVRNATFSQAGCLVFSAALSTVFGVTLVDSIARLLGGSTVWRINVGYSIAFEFPRFVGLHSSVGPTLSDLEAVGSMQVSVATVSALIILLSAAALLMSAYIATRETCSRTTGAKDCSGGSYDRHALMTYLLSILAAAILCESYFMYVPLDRAGMLGPGPVDAGITTVVEQCYAAILMLSGVLSGEGPQVGHIRAVTIIKGGAMGQPWATTVVIVLATVISMIISSTTSARPAVEFTLKTRRALAIAVFGITGGFFYIGNIGMMGLSRLAASVTVADAGIGAYAQLDGMLREIGNATYSGMPASILTDIRGSAGQPVLFLSMLRQAEVVGSLDDLPQQANDNASYGTLYDTRTVFNASYSALKEQAGSYGFNDSAVDDLMLPLHNRLALADFNFFSLRTASYFETNALMQAIQLLDSIPSYQRADALPLVFARRGPAAAPVISLGGAVEISSNETSLAVDGELDSASSLPMDEFSFTTSIYMLFSFLATPTYIGFVLIVVLTPTRGMDEATQQAASEVRGWSRADQSSRSLQLLDVEACCARCMLWGCCCGRLPACWRPDISSLPKELPVRDTGFDRKTSDDLPAIIALHEACAISRRALDCRSMFSAQDEAKHIMSLRSEKTGGQRMLRKSVSPLIQTSIDRAARIGLQLRVCAMLIIVEQLIAIYVLGWITREATNTAACTQARLDGLQAFASPLCSESTLNGSLDAVMDQESTPQVHMNAIADIAYRAVSVCIRVLLLTGVLTYARQSRELERAMDISEKQRAALQSRVRFLSHECRVPLNSVVLGLDFCQEGATAVRQALVQMRRSAVSESSAGSVQLDPPLRKRRGSYSYVSSDAEEHRTGQTTSALSHIEQAVEIFDETLPSLDAAAEAMQTTLNDVLDLQHIETGRLKITKRPNPLVPGVLAEAQRTFASQAEGVGVQVLMYDSHPASGGSFTCDPVRIRGALYNYASNALKWSRPDEKLVKRLSDLQMRGRGDAAQRPRIVFGSSEVPPHLWGVSEWQKAVGGLGQELAGRLYRVVVNGMQPGQHPSDSQALQNGTRCASAGDSSHQKIRVNQVVPNEVDTQHDQAARGINHGRIQAVPLDTNPSIQDGARGAGATSAGITKELDGEEVDDLQETSTKLVPIPPLRAVMHGTGGQSSQDGILGTAAAATPLEDEDLMDCEDDDLVGAAHVAPDTLRMYESLARDAVMQQQGAGDGALASLAIEESYVTVCLWVLDEGPGIHRKDWGKVFTPFETLHSGILTAEGQGSGLGLAITATVIRMHGGCVGFSSRAGVGSVFFVWLRMLASPAPEHQSGNRSIVTSLTSGQTGPSACSPQGIGDSAFRSLASGSATGGTAQVQLSLTAGSLPVKSETAVPKKKRRQVRKRKTSSGSSSSRSTASGVVERSLQPDATTTTNAPRPAGSGVARRKARTQKTKVRSMSQKVQSVLVVDDSRTNRLFLSRMVRTVDRSIQVLTASDGQEGLDLLRQRAREQQAEETGVKGAAGGGSGADVKPVVDLVLLDFSMPRMSGPEMAQAVRGDEDERVRGVRIVGVTGNALPEDQALFRSSGAEDILLKPVRRAQVEQLVQRGHRHGHK